MAFNITFNQLNDKAILATYETMRSKISSLKFRGLKDGFSHDISFPEISCFFKVSVDWEVIRISGLPKGVENHWMYLVQTEDGRWFLCVYIDYFNAYCLQYGIFNQAEKDYLLLRCLIHEFWHYNIPTHPVVFDNCIMPNTMFQLNREQLLAEVEDELFCMTVIFGDRDCFCRRMQACEYNFERYIKDDLKNNSVTCKEVMQYLSFCEQQKWHYVEYSFRYEDGMPVFGMRDLNTLVDCFFPVLPPYSVFYNDKVKRDFSIPEPLVKQVTTQFSGVFNNNGNYFSKGESEFDGISFFCIVNKQEENMIEREKKVTTKKIVALGYKKLDNL